MLSPGAASGQSSEANKAAAVALYDEAEELMAQRNYAAACPKYAESNRLDPQLGALMHLADCYERNEQLASAWASWRDAAELAHRRGDARESLAVEHATVLGPKLSRLHIAVPPRNEVPGLEIKLDGRALSRPLWGTAMPVDAGEHLIEAWAPGKKKVSSKVAVGGSATVAKYELGMLEPEPDAGSAGLTPQPAPPPIDPSTPSTAHRPPEAEASRGGTQRTLGWIAGGLGVIGLGAGLGFELQRSSKASERADTCPSGKNCTPDEAKRVDDLNDEVARATTLETISLFTGGALLAGGAILLLTAPSDRQRSDGGLTVGPSMARGHVGVFAAGNW